MKKILHFTLAIAIILQAASPAILAAQGDSVTIKGGSKLRTRSTLKAQIIPEDGDFLYQWTSSESADGAFVPIIGATEAEYKLSTLDAGKYIGLTATNNADGQTVVSEVTRTLDTLGPVNKTSFTVNAVNDAKNTPAENIFVVDGQSFILLGEFNSDTSKYYVMAEEFYGERAFDSNGYAKFDVAVEGNIGHYLNNEFLLNGNGGKKFPESLISHIDKNHVWWTESGLSGGDCESDYSFKAGVSLLSASEADVLYGKYGWQPKDDSGTWWLRTQRGTGTTLQDNIFAMMGVSESNKGNAVEKACSDSCKIRPVFYLDRDFFSEVKLDADKTGKNIGKTIKNNYTEAEISALYTDDELIKLGVKEIEFELEMTSATTQNGTTLTAELKNLKNQELTDVRYQWLYKNSEDEEFRPIYKENGSVYKVSTEDVGRIITVEATPVVSNVAKEKVVASKSYKTVAFGLEPRVALSAEVKAECQTTPEENLFTVGGEKFILLNEYDNADSTFLIMTEDLFGTRMYDEDKTEKFDVDDENNIGYFLNNDFVTNGNGNKKLPQSIIDHINFYHVWWTEGGWAQSNCISDYSFTAGISLISKSQYVKYFGKFGWNKGPTEDNQWWTRTSRGKDNQNTTNILCAIGNTNGGDLWDRMPDSTRSIRPVFYLDRDFFIDVKIKDAGENVIKAIADMYTVSELTGGSAGYTVKELEELGIINPPEISDISIKGTGAVNGELVGCYTYDSDKNEGLSEYGFEVSTDNMTYSTLSLNQISYKAEENDYGKYIRFYCVPKDKDGISGEKAFSEAIKISFRQEITVRDFSLAGDALSKVSEVFPQFTLVNNAGTQKTAVCVIAMYDENNHIVNVAIKNITLEGNETKTITDFKLPKETGARYAKVYLIDSLLKMNSLLGYEVVLR